MGRASSVEVLQINDSSPSSAESSFRVLDDVFLQTQTKIWLGEVLQIRFGEEVEVAELLADGELLFQVAKVVGRMLMKKYGASRYSKTYFSVLNASRRYGRRYTPYLNVDAFLKICQVLGMAGIDLFSPSDVVEKRDTRKVCVCIRSLSKTARLKDLNVPDFDVVTYLIAMPKDMVDCMRRSLELTERISSSRSSAGSHRLGIQGADYVRDSNLLSQFDEAENSIGMLELETSVSDIGYKNVDLERMSENSSVDNSVVDENFNVSEIMLLTDPKSGTKYGNIESVCTCKVAYKDDRMIVKHLISCPLCLDGQVNQTARMHCTHCGKVDISALGNYGCCWHRDRVFWRRSVYSVGNSSTDLDDLSAKDLKETHYSEICKDSISGCESRGSPNFSMDCSQSTWSASSVNSNSVDENVYWTSSITSPTPSSDKTLLLNCLDVNSSCTHSRLLKLQDLLVEMHPENVEDVVIPEKNALKNIFNSEFGISHLTAQNAGHNSGQNCGGSSQCYLNLPEESDLSSHGTRRQPNVGPTGCRNAEMEKGAEYHKIPESKPHKNFLLKSVAGSMALFGILCLLLHISCTVKVGTKKPHQKRKNERKQKSKAAAVYPGDRIKLQD